MTIIGLETEHTRSVLLWQTPPPGFSLTAPVGAILNFEALLWFYSWESAVGSTTVKVVP